MATRQPLPIPASTALAVQPALSLPLLANMPFNEWRDLGVHLCTVSKVLNWHIGDWWAFGAHAYGDRAKVAAEGIFVLGYQALKDVAFVSKSFEPSRRRDLSFTHHREVAALDAPEADALLDQAEAEKWSTRKLRDAVKNRVVVPEQTPEENMETAVLAKSNPGPAIFVPEGADLIDLCRKGISLERSGRTIESVASEFGLAEAAYRVSRQIVFLADHIPLSNGEAAVVAEALNVLAATQQYGRAWKIAEPVAVKVWGHAQRWDGLTSLADRRIEKFERTFGIVIQTCLTTEEVELPYLSVEQVKTFTRELRRARKALSAFEARIEELHP